MPQPRRQLPPLRDVPWREYRRRATVLYLWLRAGWAALSEVERAEARSLVTKSHGRPRNLTPEETHRLGRLAAKAASAAAAQRR